ncbi:hypothetical protein ATANTOWER_025800 [Ataeniobius toweri]|uniref:Uncharacterized protein n=1 Tax=Ataeniobius toweri TaxID=208326 RepID=A0ABU7AS21_9TELE|nr:hypothetical protein [Ataeniobius toweri]
MTPDPDTTSPWRPRRSSLGGQEIPDQGGINNEGPRNPGAVLRAVPLPIDEVLTSTSPPPGGHNAANGVDRVTPEVPGGWRGHGRRAECAGLDRLRLRNVKDRVYAETGRQTKTNRGRANK